MKNITQIFMSALLFFFAVIANVCAYETGDLIEFGRYPYEADGTEKPIKWKILEKYDDGTALVISKYALDVYQYNDEFKKTDWENSTLRKWLNDSFIYMAFSDLEQKNIITSYVDNEIKDSKWKTTGGDDTFDKIYLLSYWEAEKFFKKDRYRIADATPFAAAKGAVTLKHKIAKAEHQFERRDLKKAYEIGATDFSTNWWLRTTGKSHYTRAAAVTFEGLNFSYGYDVKYKYSGRTAVRPVMKIKLSGIENFNTKNSSSQSSRYKVGKIIEFGRWPYYEDGKRKPIEWLILEQYGDGTAFVISKYAIDAQPYNAEYKKTNWENSTLRNWLNNNFLSKAFTDAEQQHILTSYVDNQVKDEDEPNYSKWKTVGGDDTYDKIYLLSYWETVKFFQDDADRIANATPFAASKGAKTIGNMKKDKGTFKSYKKSINNAIKSGGTDFTTYWWLRNISKIYYTWASRVDFTGYNSGDGVVDKEFAIRPVMKINLSDINSSVGSYETSERKTNDEADMLANAKIPRARRKNADGIAVIIGVKDYDSGVNPVAYAHNDASAVKNFVIKTLGYNEENIIYETNPTKGRMEQIFGTKEDYKMQLHNWIKPGKSDVFIYYTGHGAPDQKTKSAYFVPKDADPNYIRAGGYAMETLYSNLAKLPARSITVVTDACFSGQDGRGKMIIKSASPLSVSARLPIAGRGTNSKMTVFNASRVNEMASWYDAAQHSLFTYYFLLGLSGKADADDDNIITAGELDAYLQEQVPYLARKLYNREQHPMFIGNINATIAEYK